tara:strand:- start:23478 stop:23969 length:492 start_codon:yes stop_codon:yes gene_type:complete
MKLPDIAWYLLQCKPRQDFRAHEHLTRQGFECFNPSIQLQTLKAGAIKQKVQPLFPGYIFVRVKAEDNWTALHSTRGVTRIVAFSGKPCKVQDDIVQHLQERCARVEETQALNPGDRIHVRVGPYAELDAIFVAMDGDQRVMLLLNVLNREQMIRVPLKHVVC